MLMQSKIATHPASPPLSTLAMRKHIYKKNYPITNFTSLPMIHVRYILRMTLMQNCVQSNLASPQLMMTMTNLFIVSFSFSLYILRPFKSNKYSLYSIRYFFVLQLP